MKITKPIIPLFQQFIKDTQSGRRLKKNGEKIKQASIENYSYTLKNLIRFSVDSKFDLRICDAARLDKRELTSEKNYWKKFYFQFTTYLYKKNCHDNYVGANVKIIRTFLNYLKNDKDLNTGDFHRLLYVRKEEVEILVLSPTQLKFLIHDQAFQQKLIPSHLRVKDIFVFGCTTGLRYSDIFQITNKNFENSDGSWYLKIKSQKTKTFTKIKLSDYAVAIYFNYRSNDNSNFVFRPISLFNFNKTLKQIGELAEFVHPITTSREKQGKSHMLTEKEDLCKSRFCDKMSSHMMRRTAITTLLILGMPEHLVRKISGHSDASSSFNRYIHYAQSYIDCEIEKVYLKLDSY